MNNSNLTQNNPFEEPEVDVSPLLRQRETDLMEIIDALEHIQASNYWKALQLKLFKPDLDLLKKKLQEEENTVSLFRLQGRVKEASKIEDFSKLISIKRNELENVRLQLHAKG